MEEVEIDKKIKLHRYQCRKCMVVDWFEKHVGVKRACTWNGCDGTSYYTGHNEPVYLVDRKESNAS